MRVLLLCNYLPDGQQSMLRFGELLRRSLAERGCEVGHVRPRAALAALRRVAPAALSKWIRYVDKYVFFPPALSRTVRGMAAGGPFVVHVVDHSNALYAPRLPEAPWVATCHDLLAVRGALGEDTDCPASGTGKLLQRRISAGLSRFAAVACDSTSTLRDLERIVKPARSQIRRVILLGHHHPYSPIKRSEASARLARAGGVPWSEPYLIHIGSNQPRKNKAGILRVLGRLKGRWPGNVVFCGPEFPDALREQAMRLDVASRVYSLYRPDNAVMEAAYNLAHALIFPSTCEGFGWPVIEAQACGCPVICSDRTSLPEVGGDAALIHAVGDEDGMAESVLRLAEPEFRAEVVLRGFANMKRFGVGGMVESYGRLYDDTLSSWARR